MYRIRRFGIIKTATTVAIVYMIAVAILLVPFLLIASAFRTTVPIAGGGSLDIGGGVLVSFALIAVFGYGIVGWIGTAVACAVYNVAARLVGGIEVEIDEVTAPPPPPMSWGQPAPPAVPPGDPPGTTPPYSS